MYCVDLKKYWFYFSYNFISMVSNIRLKTFECGHCPLQQGRDLERDVVRSHKSLLLRQKQVTDKVNFILMWKMPCWCQTVEKIYVMALIFTLTMGRRTLWLVVILFVSLIRKNRLSCWSPSRPGWLRNPCDADTGSIWKWSVSFLYCLWCSIDKKCYSQQVVSFA